MVSVEEAKSKLAAIQVSLKTISIDVKSSIGYVLASDVVSAIDMPPFPQSAMDGYALGKGARTAGSTFKVIGEIAAGSSTGIDLSENECVRIFTGAPVPESAIAVVQQEWVERAGNTIVLNNDVDESKNIRPRGEQIKTGSISLKEGTLIKPATIGFMNMLGIREVSVYSKPSVAILVTGNELVAAGEPLNYGQVYESNADMLASALANEGIAATTIKIKDNLKETTQTIKSALAQFDTLIISGGISVGDYDYVGKALNNLGVEQVFYKVAQKPGKPLYFGVWEDKTVFALPGNPAASLTCYYEYVLPLMRRYCGRSDINLVTLNLPFASGRVPKIGRAQFLKALVSDGAIQILEGQSSAMLNTFAQSNALVYVKPNSNQPQIGEPLEVHLLP